MEANVQLGIFLIVLTCYTFQGFAKGSANEYCVYDTFMAECEDHQVVVIKDAKYGRMRKSKCITEDNIGCYVDARMNVDKFCSGQKTCDYMAVLDKDLLKQVISKCKIDQTSYLEVSYECVEVASFDGNICSNQESIIMEQPEAYISNELFQQSRGPSYCQLRIKVLPGQIIKVMLINFVPDNNLANCHSFGFLSEPAVKYNTSVCLSPKRHRQLYTSSKNQIILQINTHKMQELPGRFLIHYIAMGCADLLAPEHAWSKRTENTVKVGCLHKNMTWHLTCHNNRWLGVVGSCNSSSDSNVLHPSPTDESFVFKGLSMKTIIVIAVGVLFIILVCMTALCVKCICLNDQSKNQSPGPHFNDDSLNRNYGYASQKLAKRSSWLYTFKKEKPERQHIWESPLPTPKIPHDVHQENVNPFVNKKEYYDSTKLSQECLSECGEYMAPVKVREKQMTKSMDSLPQRGRPEGDEYTAPMNKDPETSKAEAVIENGAEYTVPENIRNELKDSDVEYTSPSNLRFSSNADDLFPPPPTDEELVEAGAVNKNDYDPNNAKGLQCGPHGSQYVQESAPQFTVRPSAADDIDDDEYMLPTDMR